MKLKRALLAVVFAFGLVGASKPPLTDDIITDKVMIKLNADPVAKAEVSRWM